MPFRVYPLLLGAFVVPCLATLAVAGPQDDAFVRTVQPFLKQHCAVCHTGEQPEGQFSIGRLDSTKSVEEQNQAWQSVLHRLRAGEMPPRDQPQPRAEEIEPVVHWIESELDNLDCSRSTQDPGRVTIRRLNRTEYRNTIRDLVGIEYLPSEDFPVDNLGYGFDTVGDALSLSPLLMEKYLEAAEQIARLAIALPDSLETPQTRYEADVFTGGDMIDEARAMWTVSHITTPGHFPRDGRYLIKASAYARQAGDELAQMTFHVDGQRFKTVEVAAKDALPETYVAEVFVKAGERQFGVAFINDFFDEAAGQDRNLYITSMEIIGPLEAEYEANLPESHHRILFRMPASSADRDQCARDILERFVSRAYRRDVSSEEIDRLVQLVQMVERGGGSFERGIQLAVQAVLVSPQFLFRSEPNASPGLPETARPLTEFELASRLSYFLWSSMPDDALFEAARAGVLRRDLKQHVALMLKDLKSQALVENFGGQWLETRRLAGISPDPDLFPEFDEPLRAAMRTETLLFFAAVLREDRSIMDFLDGQYTFVNERLARHYGLEGVSGDHFRRVNLTGSHRSGVLTQGSVLAITSNPTRTSPVKRGKWILDQILGESPPPPPPDVPSLQDETTLTGSLRERMEQHRTNQACAGCHRRMDPLGFAMENFDAIGKWRTHDGKHQIDATDTLPNGQALAGIEGLKQMLADRRDRFRENLAEKMLTYALGRGIEFYDRCAIETISTQVASRGDRFSSLIEAIVFSDPFQNCRGEDVAP